MSTCQKVELYHYIQSPNTISVVTLFFPGIIKTKASELQYSLVKPLLVSIFFF